jgi:predicted GH43/DUF377 family glycosyl hydrolase
MKIIDIPLEDLTPCQKAFNCAIIQHEGVTKLFYRFERPHGDYNTQIGVVHLDNEFKPIKKTNQIIRLFTYTRTTTYDDPRLVVHQNKLQMFYAHGMVVRYGSQWGWCCGMGMAEIRNNRRVKQIIPSFGKNLNAATTRSAIVATEKNWSPFTVGKKLLFAYTINPLVIVEWDLDSNKCTQISESKFDQSFWKHGGFLAGGTPLVYRDGEYVGFFHAYVNDNTGLPTCRRYNFGFYSIKEIDGTWKVVRMSEKPIMEAEKDEKKDLRPANSPWLPNVVFPCGFITREDKVYVSIGWQDCRCQILEYTWDEILKDVIKI